MLLHFPALGAGWALASANPLPYEVLHKFPVGPILPKAELIQAADGNFYGTTWSGGAGFFGTIFRMDPAGQVTILHEFFGAPARDGARPNGPLLEASDGNFYGTTSEGGQFNLGTVFKMTPSGKVTILRSFGGYLDGSHPMGGLVQASDGLLYGTTHDGGKEYGKGTLFRISLTGEFVQQFEFGGSIPLPPPVPQVGPPLLFTGAFPNGLTLGGDGQLYGTTYAGGDSNLGTVFSIDLMTHAMRVASFQGASIDGPGMSIVGPIVGPMGPVGAHPQAPPILASDGNVYGTTHDGGPKNFGTIFKYDPLHNLITTVVVFDAEAGDPPDPPASSLLLSSLTTVVATAAHPMGRLTEGDGGSLYGVTRDLGGADVVWAGEEGRSGVYGSLFKLDPVRGYKTLHLLVGSEGAYPEEGLVRASDGNLYGTASSAGAFGVGTVFKIDAAGTLAKVHEFTIGGAGGIFPRGALVEATDGQFYGVTNSGGFGDRGTVFKMDANGSVVTLHTFLGTTDGYGPIGSLVEARDGNFYGTALDRNDPSNRGGMVFRMDRAGNFLTIHSFTDSEGSYPQAPLIEGRDGSLYGTTAGMFGGPDGSVFRMDLSGTLTTLCSFDVSDPADPRRPATGLIEGSDGSLYGTTLGGGDDDLGTIFKLDSFFDASQSDACQSLEVLHSFKDVDGAWAYRLLQARDGNFYGTTIYGGEHYSGTLFKMNADRSLTTLHAFAGEGNEGRSGAALIQGDDGYLYGGTSGMVFRADLDGNLTMLHVFSATDGTDGWGVTGLTQASDGDLYGMSPGGVYGSAGGTIFRILLPSLVNVIAGTPQSTSLGSAFGSALRVRVTDRVGRPIPGMSVSFTAPSSGASASFGAPPVTDANGETEVLVTANDTAGTYGVTASVEGVPAAAVFTLANMAPNAGLGFHTVSPCRAVDTRESGGALISGAARTLVLGGTCGIPASAKAVALNLTVTGATAAGSVALFPDSGPAPVPGTLSFKAGATRANNQVLAVSAVGSGSLQAVSNIPGGGSVHLAVDVAGWFE